MKKRIALFAAFAHVVGCGSGSVTDDECQSGQVLIDGKCVDEDMACPPGQVPAGGECVEPLGLMSTTPDNVAENVDTQVDVKAVFDAELDPATLSTESFVLELPDGSRVPGTVGLDDSPDTAVFTPDFTLGILNRYVATVTTDIKALSGAPLDEEQSWEFSTREGAWGTALRIEASGAPAGRPNVAVDPNGNVTVLWSQDGKIWASRSSAEKAFTPGGITEVSNLFPEIIELAVDGDGHILAVWDEVSSHRLWAAWYTPGDGWGSPEEIGGLSSGEPEWPKLAVNASGEALVVWWHREGGSDINAWVNRYTPAEGWESARRLENDSKRSISPDIAINERGDAVAVWVQGNTDDGLDDPQNVWASRYTKGQGWSVAGPIESNDSWDNDPSVALAENGDAFVLYSQLQGLRSDMWATRFVSGEGWGTPQRIENENDGNVGNPEVRIDPTGGALATWRQDGVGTGRFTVRWSRFEPLGGWTAPARVEPSDANLQGIARFAVDRNGNAIVVWQESNSTSQLRDVRASRYTPEAGWSASIPLETDNSTSHWSPRVAIGANGVAAATWYAAERPSVGDIWAVEFK